MKLKKCKFGTINFNNVRLFNYDEFSRQKNKTNHICYYCHYCYLSYGSANVSFSGGIVLGHRYKDTKVDYTIIQQKMSINSGGGFGDERK